MKKTYNKPQVEIAVFNVENVITTSTINTANATALEDSYLDIDYNSLFSIKY